MKDYKKQYPGIEWIDSNNNENCANSKDKRTTLEFDPGWYIKSWKCSISGGSFLGAEEVVLYPLSYKVMNKCCCNNCNKCNLRKSSVYAVFRAFEGVQVSYAKDEVREEELIRRCRSILREDWGLSEEAFMPVVKQTLNAIDSAVKERTDSVGKTICNQLKEMRRQFARANHIEYYEEDCTETKPCAGTCPYCEERTKYLVNEAKKIAAVRDVIYPQFSDVKIQKEQVDPPYEDRPFLGGVGREYEPDLDGAV